MSITGTDMQQVAESLTDNQLATLLAPLAEKFTLIAEKTQNEQDGVLAFIITAAGYRLAQYAEAKKNAN